MFLMTMYIINVKIGELKEYTCQLSRCQPAPVSQCPSNTAPRHYLDTSNNFISIKTRRGILSQRCLQIFINKYPFKVSRHL